MSPVSACKMQECFFLVGGGFCFRLFDENCVRLFFALLNMMFCPVMAKPEVLSPNTGFKSL